MYQKKHIYSVYIFFNPLESGGPFKYGPLVFDLLPIFICHAISEKAVQELSIQLGIQFRTCRETYIAGRTIDDAETIIGRLKALIGTEDKGGPLKDLSKTSAKKKSLSKAHRAKIASAKTGLYPSNQTREKLRAAALGKPKPWLRGNQNRAMSWIVTDPHSREYFVFNLNKFCREHGVPQGGLWAVAEGRRRHYKWWKCRRV